MQSLLKFNNFVVEFARENQHQPKYIITLTMNGGNQNFSQLIQNKLKRMTEVEQRGVLSSY